MEDTEPREEVKEDFAQSKPAFPIFGELKPDMKLKMEENPPLAPKTNTRETFSVVNLEARRGAGPVVKLPV